MGWPDWTAQTAVIVASGPSAQSAPIDLAQGRARVLVINESWRLAPWADALYACDARFWQQRRPDFAGLKFSYDRVADAQRVTLLRRADRLILDGPGKVGDGGNSGFQALNLAVSFGAARIVLVGFDMRIDRGLHWHGRHGAALRNPTPSAVIRWRKALDGAAPVLSALGVETLNASPISALTAYPVVGLEDAI